MVHYFFTKNKMIKLKIKLYCRLLCFILWIGIVLSEAATLQLRSALLSEGKLVWKHALAFNEFKLEKFKC